MITLSYDGHATVCNLMSVIWEDPERKWILIKMASYPSEGIRKRITSDSPIDIACPDSDYGETQYDTCRNQYGIADEEYAMLSNVIKANASKDEPFTEFFVKRYEKKVKL